MVDIFYFNIIFICAIVFVLTLWYKAKIEKDVTFPLWGFLTLVLSATFICILQIQSSEYTKAVLECYNLGGCKTTSSQKNIIKNYEMELSEKEIQNKLNKGN